MIRDVAKSTDLGRPYTEFAKIESAPAASKLLPSCPLSAARITSLSPRMQVLCVPFLVVTVNLISSLKRAYSGLMVEMGYFYPDRRFVWQ